MSVENHNDGDDEVGKVIRALIIGVAIAVSIYKICDTLVAIYGNQ